MRAAVFAEAGRVDLCEVPDPVVGDHDVVVEVSLCGVCGSDVASFDHGAYVDAGQIMGHEVCGRVAAVGSSVAGVAEGQQVAVLPMRSCGECAYCASGRPHLCGATAGRSLGYGAAGGFADRVLLRDVRPGVDLIPVASSVAPEDLVWAEPVAVAVHAARLLGPSVPARVLVMGAGSVGLCVTAVLTAWGSDVAVVEPRADRRLAAQQLGARAAASVDGLDAAARSFPAVVDTSGSAIAIAEASDACLAGASVVLVGLGASALPLPGRGITMRGSFAYTPDDFAEAVTLIEGGSISLGRFVSHRFPLDRAGAAIAASASDPTVVKAVVVPASREVSP